MSLLQEARSEQLAHGPGCRVRLYLDLYDDLGEALDAIRAETLDAAALERALAKRWTPELEVPKIKADTIRRHVKNECTCVPA